MPVMDGLEATRRIHALPGLEKLPVIAMTAAAMSQDRADSTAAGMIAHVAKPVDPQELADTLVRWVKPRQTSDDVELPPVAAASDIAALEYALPGFSVRKALDLLYGDDALYHQLLHSFAEHHASTPDRVLELLQAGDNEPLYQLAHGLKGEAGNLGVDTVCNSADVLAKAIRQGAVGQLKELGDALALRLKGAVELAGSLPALPSAARQDAGAALREIKFDLLTSLLQKLMPLLEAKSFRAREVVCEVAALLEGTSLADEFREIDHCAAGLRYDAALAQLNKLLERLPKS